MGRYLLPIGAVATAIGFAALGAPAIAANAHRAPTSAKPAAASKKTGDINGDGYADQVAGAPNGTVGGHAKAGYIGVTYGTPHGVDIDHHQGLTQSHTGVPGVPEASDHFGSSVTVGDVDGDGYADVIIGASGEDIGSTKNAGSVTIVFGSASGLSTKAIAFHEPKVSSDQDFGEHLTVGDFNHDGRQDVAISEADYALAHGRVWLVYGAKNLRSMPTPTMTSFTPPDGGMGTSEIATGDINGDGYADLAAVVFNDDPADEGTLTVLPGSKDGLKTTALGKNIGLPFADYHAAVGDINGDGKDDVVIDTGAADGPDDYKLRTFPGTANGLDGANPVVWKGEKQSGEGARLADVDGDGHADLVVADTDAPDSDGIQDAGAITVLKGTSNWLTDSGAQKFSLDTKGVSGVAEGGDEFGADVAPADYNGDGVADLALGVPGKHDESGAVSMLYGSKSGVTASGSILFDPSSVNWPEQKAGFGTALGFAPPR